MAETPSLSFLSAPDTALMNQTISAVNIHDVIQTRASLQLSVFISLLIPLHIDRSQVRNSVRRINESGV